MRKLINLLTLLTLFFTTAGAEELTATLDMMTSQTSPVTVNGVTFSWNNSNSHVVTGSGNSSGFQSGADMTITLPEGATLINISKTNGGSWGSGATITVYAGSTYNGTPVIASIVQGINSYNISSNNTGGIFYFENISGKNAFIRSLSIKYSISSTKYNVICNENIDNGSISANPTEFAAGSTVTITAEPNNGYKLSTVTVTPEVGAAPAVTISGNTATFIMPACNVEVDANFTEAVTKHYKLVESADDLVAGAKYILAGKTDNSTSYQALLGAITDNYGSTVTSGFSYDPSNNILTVEDVCAATPLTLGGQNGAWTFHNGSGYLNLPSDGNYLSTVDEVGDYSKWIIATSKFPSSEELIQIQVKTQLGTTKSRFLDYNPTGSRFAAYDDPLSPVALFKEVEAHAVAASVAEILALDDDTEFVYTGENLIVSGKSDTDQDLYAQDATGGVHFRGTTPDYSFGQVIPAGFIATKKTYNGAVELIDMQNMSEATVTSDLNAIELTPSQVTQNNPFTYALIKNALIEQAGSYLRINVNGETVSLQETFNGVETPTVGKTYNIHGVTNWNNGARFMPLSFELLEGVHTITCKAISDMPDNHEEQTYKEGGTVIAKVNGSTITQAIFGDIVTLEITPWSGYTFSSVTVNGIEIAPDNDVYTFEMPDEDVEVIANFVAGGYPITVNSSDGAHHGTYNGPYFATVGETVEFTINDVENGYSVMGVSATFINKNGGTTSVAVTKENGIYSFGMPPFPVKITVHYSHHLLVTGNWDLVTDASQLVEGHKYIIVHQDDENPSAMSTTQNRNNRGTTGIDLNANYSVATITNEDTQVFTLEGDASGWYLNAGNGYLYAASSANNWLRTGHQKSDDAKAAISINNGIASIVFQGSNTHNDLRYNPNSNGEPLFSCYAGTSELSKVSLYTRGEFNPGTLLTLNPPEFWPDPQENPDELMPEGFYVELWTEYEDMGAIYYMLDPETAPTQTIEVINNGKRCDHGYGYGEIYVPGPGEHTIYAVVEVEYERERYYSTIASRTYNTYSLGDWKLVTNNRDLFVSQYEYIIINDDFDKAVGAYENGHFNAISCNENNNVVFDPTYETATVNSDDVKTFSLEYVQGSGSWREGYLYDSDGTYYHGVGPNSYYDQDPPETTFSDTQGLVWAYNGGHTGYVYLESENSNLVYNIDKGYFDCYNWNYPLQTDNDQRTRIRLYYRAKPITLAELCRSGNVRGEYTISDELIAVACAEDDWGNVYLWCKDAGIDEEGYCTSINPSLINPKAMLEGMEDYMAVHSDFKGDWDQSNWIALRFSNGGYRGGTSDLYNTIKGYVGWKIKEGTVKGIYVDNINYQLDISTTNLEKTEPFEYPLNLYSPANFLSQNIDADGAVGETPNTHEERNYFFMNPKIQEVCEITFAVWKEVKDENDNIIDHYFVLPAPQGVTNATNIPGAFYVDWIFNNMYSEDAEGNVLYNLYEALVPGAAYKFKAIVQKPVIIKKAGAPSLRDGDESATATPGNYNPDWSNYMVYPFDFDPKNPENIVTTIENIAAFNGEVKSVKYVNVAGIVSDRPFEGVNIVVTEYTDGSRTTSKMLKK